MSEAHVARGADGELMLSGVLDYLTGPALRRAGQALIRAEEKDEPLRIDLSAVERSSSVGLSLLLAFIRDARAVGREVIITAMPDDMQQIVRVSGLQDVLPLADSSAGAV